MPQMLCFYLVSVSPCAFNFDLESQREVGVWGAPGPGVGPGHCSIAGHVLALGRVRLYCRRKHRGNSFMFTTECWCVTGESFMGMSFGSLRVKRGVALRCFLWKIRHIP